MEKPSFHLDCFEGPLDLLLHLIIKNKLNITDIPISELLRQYLEYIDFARAQESQTGMEIASEFLEMAARLLHIKTLMLLPRREEAEELRRELTGELIEYQACREVATKLGGMTAGFGTFKRKPLELDPEKTYNCFHEPFELADAYAAAAGRGMRRLPPPVTVFKPLVTHKIVSVTSRIVFILRKMRTSSRVLFSDLFHKNGDRSESVATFLAVLELIKAERLRVDGDGSKAKISLITKLG
ncbi:MAG: segregation/condensation protein A [Oscillospiraceae bacterium]|jgi:segregation and condensation protein A|nr:segregation/condensation protein A [Oscillospiraceae bacterium]